MNKDAAMMNNDALQNSSVSEVVLSWHLKEDGECVISFLHYFNLWAPFICVNETQLVHLNTSIIHLIFYAIKLLSDVPGNIWPCD